MWRRSLKRRSASLPLHVSEAFNDLSSDGIFHGPKGFLKPAVDAIHAAGGPTNTAAILLLGISATTTIAFFCAAGGEAEK